MSQGAFISASAPPGGESGHRQGRRHGARLVVLSLQGRRRNRSAAQGQNDIVQNRFDLGGNGDELRYREIDDIQRDSPRAFTHVPGRYRRDSAGHKWFRCHGLTSGTSGDPSAWALAISAAEAVQAQGKISFGSR